MPTSIMNKELNSLLNREVIIEFKDGSRLRGILRAVDPSTLNIVIGETIIGKDKYKAIVYSGDYIKAIYVKERYIDLSELRRRLERVFPRMVEYRVSDKSLIVMNKIKVTEEGVYGEPGPVYNRVKRVYDEYIEEIRK